MQKQFDLVGIGECLIELFEEAPHLYKQSIAGDVFNTLFYASRLGLNTGFVSRFGSDDLTKNIIGLMDKEGIDRSCTTFSLVKNNGLYLISTNDSGDPHYSFWRNDSAARETLRNLDVSVIESYLRRSAYFHFSAIALAIIQDRDTLTSILRKVHGQTRITFDTNFRKGLWDDVDKLKTFIETASAFVDVLFVSGSDDESIYGSRPAEEALGDYQRLGYSLVIFKQGNDDVLAGDGKRIIRVPVEKSIKVVDATAAGDAFNAGFIYSQIRGENLVNSIRFGNVCAAFVITRHGGIVEDFHKQGLLATQ